ncbi:MAG: AraC family transcriptional regulator [Cytophagaceae bacterium SCN 52-12]|nr:MAG: AraC family transcriptional regulator [Cytophagaceae bacterium SCN 52-12]
MAKEKYSILNEYHLNRHQPDKPQLAILDLNHHILQNQCQVTKPHIHSFYQIIWFKAGTGKHFVDFNGYDVIDNTFFFIAPNQVHYFDDHTGYEGTLIHFNEAFLVKSESETDFFLRSNLFNNPYQQPYFCIGTDNEGVLETYISQIKREFENDNDFGRELILRNYLESFLIQIQRRKNAGERSSGHLPELVNEKRLQLARFVNLVDENYKKGLSIAEYARLLHVSTRSLSDLTGQLLSKTPSQMIQERIILEAQRLLLYSNLNVNQIGYRLGFDDASYFVKYFKKHTGISPSEFRRSVS